MSKNRKNLAKRNEKGTNRSFFSFLAKKSFRSCFVPFRKKWFRSFLVPHFEERVPAIPCIFCLIYFACTQVTVNFEAKVISLRVVPCRNYHDNDVNGAGKKLSNFLLQIHNYFHKSYITYCLILKMLKLFVSPWRICFESFIIMHNGQWTMAVLILCF